MLSEDDLCVIYKKRPEVCRVKPETSDADLYWACAMIIMGDG